MNSLRVDFYYYLENALVLTSLCVDGAISCNTSHHQHLHLL